MSTARFVVFEQNLSRATDMVGLGMAIGGMTFGKVDSSEMYRAALTLGVGAFDSYVHGVVLDRGVDIILGRVPSSADDTKVSLHLRGVSEIVNASTPVDQELAARTYFAARLTSETFQRPDDVARALSVVGVPKIWSTAFSNAESAKLALSLVVRRRNAIVHQCDADPVTHAMVTPMTDADARDALSVLRSTAAAIDIHI
jgi:hypothetical protein